MADQTGYKSLPQWVVYLWPFLNRHRIMNSCEVFQLSWSSFSDITTLIILLWLSEHCYHCSVEKTMAVSTINSSGQQAKQYQGIRYSPILGVMLKSRLLLSLLSTTLSQVTVFITFCPLHYQWSMQQWKANSRQDNHVINLHLICHATRLCASSINCYVTSELTIVCTSVYSFVVIVTGCDSPYFVPPFVLTKTYKLFH